jgi:hypothetical protein
MAENDGETMDVSGVSGHLAATIGLGSRCALANAAPDVASRVWCYRLATGSCSEPVVVNIRTYV